MAEKQEIFTLLNGAIKMRQSCYNPTSDAVWLAAFPYTEPNTILDVGIGSGGVSLCLQHHFPNAKITGIDSSPTMLQACSDNSQLNGFHFDLINADILTWSTDKTFDLVVTNPPYFIGTPSPKHPDAHHNTDLTRWIRRSLARVKPRGYICVIVDAARMAEVIHVITKSCGHITILPLFGTKQVAERVLIRGRLGTNGGSTIHLGYPMNYDPILRDGLTIENILSNIRA
ncbi:MAG: methyltransferase domain-containing protein [Proteobacteria bacterium]|nr:methyltransferase domain-containing protein [Candidatus Enterousia onthequi]